MTSRSYIMKVVGLVAQYQATPKETHVQVVKIKFKYLKGTLDFGLQYSRGKDFTLTTYIDADWEDNIDDKKSTSGGAFFLGNSLLSWLRKKQPSISISITKAEYISTKSCCTQVIWMKQTLRFIKVEYDHPISILCDNTSVINISNNHFMH